MSLKYQIFVSSTYEDLKDERNEVIKACLNMGHIPVGMEMFNAADEEQWAVITRTIDQCDYYVVIVAHRYGSTRGRHQLYREGVRLRSRAGRAGARLHHRQKCGLARGPDGE